MSVKIKTQNEIIEKIKNGKTNGIHHREMWEYTKIENDKHLLWVGKKMADITKKINK